MNTYVLLALLVIFIVFIIGLFLRFSLVSPFYIVSVIWFTSYSVGLIYGDYYYPLNNQGFGIWLLWYSVFIIVFVIIFLGINGVQKRNVIINQHSLVSPNYSFALIFLIGYLVYLFISLNLFSFENPFLVLRLNAVGIDKVFDDIRLDIVGRFYPIIWGLFVFENVYRSKENYFKRLLLWLLMIIYGLISVSKLYLFAPFFMWFVIRVMLEGKLRFLWQAQIIGASFTAMVVIDFLRGGDLNFGSLLSIYIYSPLIAISYFDFSLNDYFAPFLFRFFYAIGESIGIMQMPIGTVFPYVYVPAPVNAFTVMFPYYHDFGYPGVALGAFLHAVIFSFLYARSVVYGGFWLCIYAGLSICLLMQFFNDSLSQMLSFNMQIIITSFVVHMISRRLSVQPR